MSHTNTWEPDGIYRKFTDTVSGDEILESNFELQSSPNFLSIHYIINDFTEVTGHSIEVVHTKAYASTDEVISASKLNLKIALIVTQGPLIELAYGYREQMKSNRFECEILETIEAARDWISTT